MAGSGTSGYFSDTEASAGNNFCAWIEVGKFFVCDTDTVYNYDAEGNLVGTLDLIKENSKPSGMAVVGTNVYVLDQAGKEGYCYSYLGGEPTVSKTLKKVDGSSIGNPKGLAIDGDEMWVVNWGPDNIYRYSLSEAFSGPGELNAIEEIALVSNNQHSTGLAIDSVFLYVLDEHDEQLYRYPRAGGIVTASRVLKEVDGSDLQTPAGAMVDGASIYVVDSGRDKMYEYDIASLFLGSGDINAISEFDLDSANNKGSGM